MNSEIIEKNKYPEKLIKKIELLPTSPGIYQYKNSSGKIIYVGKAKNLRNRVRSYFQTGRIRDAKTTALISKINDIEIILVDSETEAFILENNLIKKYKPHYNILLKDDKTYPFIRITKEDYPQIFFTRKLIRDGSTYLGPYTDLKSIKYLLNTLLTIFQIRTCNQKLTYINTIKNTKRPCLEYYINKCKAPCINAITKEEYNENVKMVIQVLLGKTKNLLKDLEEQMLSYSEKLEFEKAGNIKRKIELLHDFSSKQKIVSTDLVDRDVFGIAIKDNTACSLVFNIREGKLISKHHFIISNTNSSNTSEILERTIEKLYYESDMVPKELLIPAPIEQEEYIISWLKTKTNKNISIVIPQIGDKHKLIKLANTNASYILDEYLLAVEKRDQRIPYVISTLQKDLNLKKLPRRIECYDNSHIQGTDIVSSMVVFIDAKPKKSEYRKYKAKEIDYNDDFATMRETIYRRFKRAKDEGQQLPDLVIIDGGKGQLSSAFRILKELELDKEIAIIGLAKRLEEIFIPNQSDSIILPKTSSSLKLIQQLRDEAHRFAITFHRQLREKHLTTSSLDNIQGIGNITKIKLLKKYKTINNIKNADDTELLDILSSKQLKALRNKFENSTNSN